MGIVEAREGPVPHESPPGYLPRRPDTLAAQWVEHRRGQRRQAGHMASVPLPSRVW